MGRGSRVVSEQDLIILLLLSKLLLFLFFCKKFDTSINLTVSVISRE